MLVAASTLNIFNNHADRVKGANLAQTVNVIHALILTKGSQMLLTPTYYVFEIYKVHQDARLLPLQLESPLYMNDKDTVKAVNASASIDSNRTIHISLVNLNPNQAITVSVKLPGIYGKTFSGQLLTSGKVTDINTFEQPDRIHLVAFHQASLDNNKLTVTLPAKSVVMLEIKR